MKKLFFYWSLLLPLAASAQVNRVEECRSPSLPYDQLRSIPPAQLKVLTGTAVIKMVVTIYANDDGTNQAITEEEVKTEMAFTNSVYNQGEVCFVLAGIRVRRSSFYNNANSDTTSFAPDTVSGFFNVFVPFSLVRNNGNTVFGYSYGPNSNYMVTKKEGFGTRRTFIHEMGHGLGLPHTWKGTGLDPENPGTEELADGSNGETAGDFVADTPADPYEKCGTAINGCTFPYTAPACQDANGDGYAPQMTNFMSYWANYGCLRSVFTAGQYARMRSTIANTPNLARFLAPDYRSLSGSTVSSGIIREAAKITLLAGSNLLAPNAIYVLNGTANVTLSAGYVTLSPGFTAAPGAFGVVNILGSSCQ